MSISVVWLGIWYCRYECGTRSHASHPAAHMKAAASVARSAECPATVRSSDVGTTPMTRLSAAEICAVPSPQSTAGAPPQSSKSARPAAGQEKPSAPVEGVSTPGPGSDELAATGEEEESDDDQNTLMITTPALPPAFAGLSYYVPLFASGGTLPYKWSVVEGALPPGLSLNQWHGTITGTPQKAGAVEATIMVTDASMLGASASCTIDVREQGGVSVPCPGGVRSEPLYITTGSLPDAKINQPYSAQIAARGGIPPYTWSVSMNNLPDGISLQSQTGALSGMPSKVQLAVLRIGVNDTAQHSDIAELSINVAGLALAITTALLEAGTTGTPYESTLQATGGSPPYRWRVSSGTLPPGLSLDASSGLISGTPVAPSDSLISFQVSDAGGVGEEGEFELVIDPVGLAIMTERLPQGELNKAYNAMLTADGGQAPYTWSLSGGHLPPGLSLTAGKGVIGGTPTDTAGDYPLHITVADAVGTLATRPLTLTIVEPSSFTVTDMNAAHSDGKVGLTWTNPVADGYACTVITRSTTSYTSAPSDGVAIYTGTNADFLDTNLTNGTTYFYSALPYKSDGTPGSAGDGSSISALPQAVTLTGAADPFADAVVSFRPLMAGGYGSGMLANVLGAPHGMGAGMGSTHVVSLGARVNDDNGATPPYGGSITVQFTNNIVVNGDGPDFIVFENVFYVGGDPERRWMEPAIVSVSKDGSHFYTFPYDFVPHYTASGEINCYNPYCYMNEDGSSRGFAGINPVYSNCGSPDPRDLAAAGGDAFDLSSIAGVNLDWIRYVRITSTGDNWLTDINGDRVRHVTDIGACSGSGSSGFDLDAVCAIHY